MVDAKPEQAAVNYDTQGTPPWHSSPFAVASLVVSIVFALCFFLDFFFDRYLPFDVYKRHNIGTVATLVAVILAVASYSRPNRRRGLTHLATAVAILVFLGYLLIVPL